jgi:6-phosphogluconolactonase
MEPQIKIFDTPDDLSFAAADMFLKLAAKAVSARGKFTVALSGGTTPVRMYGILASPPYSEKSFWSKAHFFWGDDRQEVPGGQKTDLQMVRETMLDKLTLPADHIHPMDIKNPDPAAGAKAYEQDIIRTFGLAPGKMPCFDLVLLGLGADGHTASLFPEAEFLKPGQPQGGGRVVAGYYVEAVKQNRMSLTVEAINAAAEVIFLAEGEKKASMVKTVLETPQGAPAGGAGLPAQLIRPTTGQLTWMLDKPAAKFLRPTA